MRRARQAAARREDAMEWVIDPRNPGEVFACAGLAHLAWREDRAAETGFERDGHRRRFVAPDLSAPFERLAKASPEETADGLRFAGVELDWWREWGLNPELKNWAGQQTELTVHGNLVEAARGSTPREWLDHRAPATGRLNVDCNGTWNALNMGWSLNEHEHFRMLCRPWVELLASIGLQAFPVRGRRSEGGFEYNLWRSSPLPIAVSAFGGHGPGVYSTGGFVSKTEKSGSNTMLRVADPA